MAKGVRSKSPLNYPIELKRAIAVPEHALSGDKKPRADAIPAAELIEQIDHADALKLFGEEAEHFSMKACIEALTKTNRILKLIRENEIDPIANSQDTAEIAGEEIAALMHLLLDKFAPDIDTSGSFDYRKYIDDKKKAATDPSAQPDFDGSTANEPAKPAPAFAQEEDSPIVIELGDVSLSQKGKFKKESWERPHPELPSNSQANRSNVPFKADIDPDIKLEFEKIAKRLVTEDGTRVPKRAAVEVALSEFIKKYGTPRKE